MTSSCEKVGLEFFDSAPTRHHARQEVAATPEQVFAVLLDGNEDRRRLGGRVEDHQPDHEVHDQADAPLGRPACRVVAADRRQVTGDS
jgi:hypothetical protein